MTTTTASTAGSPRILPFGDRGLLAEVASLDEAVALHAALAVSRPRGVIGLVPAARTVLVEIDPDALSLAAARRWIAGARGGEDAAAPDPPIVELPIAYDGPDLADLAAALDIAPDELVAQHTATVWTVAFTGFAPGFGYLVSADWPYDVPRRASPRTRVPAGAVGLAGEFTGAYPRETPGGWQLIGTTGAVLFDPTRAVPGLLAPGSRVRFVPTPPSVLLPPAVPPARVSSRGRASAGAPAFTVVSPGSLSTVQDQGRPGHGAEGIAPAGAADRAALRTANRLVGNSEDAAGVEITLGGFRAVADVDLWIALTGAWGTAYVGERTLTRTPRHSGRGAPNCASTASPTVSAGTSPSGAASTGRAWPVRARPTRCRVSARRRSARVPASRSPTPRPSRRSRRVTCIPGVARPTLSRSPSLPVRGRTGSRMPQTSTPAPGPSPPRPIASASVSRAHRSRAPNTVRGSCRARACSRGRSRSRRTGCPSFSAPTAP